ncbi:hypothetical protein B0O99DRAFT_747042 [Bisporella sp. PMI_857]|nr:hypothetical protein B0O99DRAFT_747042 [Bisporella sp. PMI_857]
MQEDRYSITIAMGIFMAIIAALAVLLRFESRRLRKTGFATDDYIIVVALICLIGMSVCNIVGAVAGRMGTHDSIRTSASKQKIAERTLIRSKVIWILQLLTTLGPGLTRTSILFFYKRIFIGKYSQINSWTFIVVNGIWTISYFFGNIFGCVPLKGNWIHDPNGKCIDFFMFYKSMVISDVILDGLVLMIPWYPVWKLNMPIRQKVTVCGIFLLGGFVVLSGVVRIIAMFNALKPNPDRSYERAPAFYWATIETGVGIVSACLPTMRPLLSRSGPESIIRSVQRKIQSTLSRTKLVPEDYTLQHRPSEGSDTLPFAESKRGKTGVYEGPPGSTFQPETKVEVTEKEHSTPPLDGIRVESSVSYKAQNYHQL